MSAYSAVASYRLELDAWHVQYDDDGRGVVCETVEAEQLRAVPAELARCGAQQLWRDDLLRIDSFSVGDGVEIQWRRQNSHPFGWWYALLAPPAVGTAGHAARMRSRGVPLQHASLRSTTRTPLTRAPYRAHSVPLDGCGRRYGQVERIWHDDRAETGEVGDIVHVRMAGASQATAILVPEEQSASRAAALRREGAAGGAAGSADAGAAAQSDKVGEAVGKPAGAETPASPLWWAGMEAGEAEQAEEAEQEGAAERPTPEEPPLLTKVTVVFPQYVERSPWRRVTVVLGTTSEVRSLGGWVGGIRPAAGRQASRAERTKAKAAWDRFLPDKRIL